MRVLILCVVLALCGASIAAARVRDPWLIVPPMHHTLWLCIHGTPALGTRVGWEASSWDNADTGHNGHYGGLQMTYRWLGLIPGYASDLTQMQQEHAAEKGYRQSGYSEAWLRGQWAPTIAPCLRYA